MFICLQKRDFRQWSKVYTDKMTPEDWDALLGGYRSLLDFPGSTAYPELMKAFPNAKVILSVRDPDRWAASVADTIWCPYSRSMSWVLYPWFFHFQNMFMNVRKRFFNDRSGGRRNGDIRNVKVLAQRFREWNDRVRREVPAEKLLEFNPADGWAPLCRFLEVPVPDEPFPFINDAAEFKADMRARWRKYLMFDIGIVAGIAGAGIFGLRKLLKRS